MTKSKPKANSTTPSTSTKSRATSTKAKSTAPKAIPKRKSNSSTSASPLFNGNEGAELRHRIDRLLNKPKGYVFPVFFFDVLCWWTGVSGYRRASPSPATTYPTAYREAVRGKMGIGRGTEDDDHDGGDEEAAGGDDDDDAGHEPGKEDVDEGDEHDGEVHREDGTKDEPEQGEELLLDDDEEREMRTVKGKGKVFVIALVFS